VPQLQPPPYQDAQGTQRWSEWFRKINDLLSGVSQSINNIDDVVITGVTDKELLSYDSGTSKWINQTGTEWGIVNDTTPQLGGDLDTNGNSIVSVSDGDITIAPDGTGKVLLGGDLDTQSNNIIMTDSDFIIDASGNEWVQFISGGGATHYFTIRNASSTNPMILSVNSVSSNVNIALSPKGTGWVEVGKQHMGPPTTVTATTHAVVRGDRYLLCDTTSNAITVNLRAASTAGAGARLDIKLVNATNAVTIDGSGSETIDGTTTKVLNTLYDNLSLVCDGSNWHIL